MENTNLYYDMNENPNIFPASRSYNPQTQIRDNRNLSDINKRFRDLANQQQEEQDQIFFSTSGNNLSGTSFAATRAARSIQSLQPQHQEISYANTPSVYGDQQPQQPQQPLNGNEILQVNELNNSAVSTQAYPHVFMPQPFYQLPQKNLIDDPDPDYLSIDSHDRDRTKFPNPNEYTIPLVSSDTNGQGSVPGRRYKNVTSIELISAVIPNRANVLDEIYLILDIPEIEEETYHASNHNLSKGFAKLLFCKCDGTLKWLRLDIDLSDPLHKIYYPKPKASLDKITIRLLKRDGTPFNFGTDNSLPADVNLDLQNSFTFKITEKVTDANILGQRNV